MGTVYARGRRLWIGFMGPDGKQICRSSGYVVGQELLAEKDLAAIEARMRAGKPVDVSYTVREYAARWSQRRIEKGKHTNAGLDAKAFENHVVGAELDVGGRRVIFGKLQLGEVRLVHVRAFLEHLELKNIGTKEVPNHFAPRTRRSIFNLVQRMFSSAVREELIEKSPCQLERGELPVIVDKDSTWRQGAVFGTRELERLVSDELVPLDRRVTYAIGFCCGLREGEISALTWADFEREREGLLGCLSVFKSYTRKNKRVKETKAKVPRTVPVHPVAAALLAEWSLRGWRELFGRRPKPTDLLVPNRAGRHLTDLNIVENLRRDLAKLGLRPRHMHDTRRTFVTLAQAGGARWEFLRFVSHGPSKKEMQSVYTVPPWAALCEQVQCLKVQLRGDAALIPLSAAVGAAPVTTFSTTPEAAAMEATAITNETSVPRARFEAGRGSTAGGRGERFSSPYEIESTAGDRQKPADRSTATTVVRLRRPFRGGMQIDDDDHDRPPASSTAGVRRG